MIKSIFLLPALFLALLFCAPAGAGNPNSPYVEQAEAYMQQLRTAKAGFDLMAPDGSFRTGTFYLKRPGRLRFEYDQSPFDLIVADGTLLHFYDSYNKQTESAPIQATLANFFLRNTTKFSGDVRVVDVQEQKDYVHIILVQTKDPEAGDLTLSFTKQPFQLKGWRVAEATGGITRLRLKNLQQNPDLSASLFTYKDPAGRGGVNR